MSVEVIINNVPYGGVKQALVSRNFENASGQFQLVLSPLQGQIYPIRANSNIQINVSGQTFLTGFVDMVTVDQSANISNITITGRDVICDFVDSSVPDIKTFEGGVTLTEIAETLINGLGLENVRVINSAGQIEPFTGSDITSASVGQSCFSFLESYARKRQVMITTDGLGNLLFRRSELQAPTASLINDIGGNVVSIHSEVDFTGRFNRYRAKSQSNLAAGLFSGESENQSAEAVDDEIRSSRFLEFQSEEASDNNVLQDRVNWEANYRRSQSIVYSPTVVGFTYDQNNIWNVGQFVSVRDPAASTNATMIVAGVQFSFSEAGSFTALRCLTADAFSLEAQRPQRTRKSDGLSLDFILNQASDAAQEVITETAENVRNNL